MTVLKIYNLEDSEEIDVVSVLSEGEHVLGRGAILRCNDKRVSRNHAVITVSKDGVTIKAVHINPCFFKASNGNNISILAKNSQTELKNGDQFALLADLFWFKVKIFLNNDSNDNSVFKEQGLENSTLSSVGTNTSTKNGSPSNPSKRCFDEENVKTTCKRQRLSDTDFYNEPSTSTSPNKNVSPNKKTSPIKEACTERSISASLDLLLDKSDNISNTSAENANVSAINPEALLHNLKSIVAEDYGSGSAKNDNKEMVSDDESSEDDKVDESAKIKRENVSVSEEEKEKLETSDRNDAEAVEGEPDIPNEAVKKESEKDEKEKQNVNTDGASSSTDGQDKKSRRERCWFGATCYRKNPLHQTDFSHPGDDDYASDPDDDRPDCPFGAACYRRNLQHRRVYKHPNPPAPKPNDGDGDGTPKKKIRSPKKKPKPDSGDSEDTDNGGGDSSENDTGTTKRKKRKAAMKKIKTQDSSEDDYDYKDPFIDDATSDEFKMSSDDDNSTDWEDSQQVDEESQTTKRLLKEAKRFTKPKKKKDD